ncbi:unnamed protein product [Closterium sp. NIES-64]|nr:unnamed protein product [Closterium sp. NIES-64]
MTAFESTQMQILGPQELQVVSGALFPYVLPLRAVPRSDHVEPFPEGLFGCTYEAHCRWVPPWEATALHRILPRGTALDHVEPFPEGLFGRTY